VAPQGTCCAKCSSRQRNMALLLLLLAGLVHFSCLTHW
jgi:hypothetical protein